MIHLAPAPIPSRGKLQERFIVSTSSGHPNAIRTGVNLKNKEIVM